MNTIFKYPINITDRQTINIPRNAKILCVQTQHEKPCLWAKVDSDEPLVHRMIITHGTGHPIPETTGEYIGTYQLKSGALVFHVFEAALLDGE